MGARETSTDRRPRWANLGVAMAVLAAPFAAGLAVGAVGLSLLLRGSSSFQAAVLDRAASGPRAQVHAFVAALREPDASRAESLWVIDETWPAEKRQALSERRTDVVAHLLASGVASEYTVLHVQWWNTCCEPSITCDWPNAGGARLTVQFLDAEGMPVQYTFDVFAKDDPYEASIPGLPQRWILRDVYRLGEQPIFWPLVAETDVHGVP